MYIPRFQTNPLPLDSSQHFFPFLYFLNTFYVYFIQSNLAKNITNTLFSSIPYFCQTDTAKTGLISLRYATMHAYIHHDHRGQLFPRGGALYNHGRTGRVAGKLSPSWQVGANICGLPATGFRGPLQFVTTCQIFSFILHRPIFTEYDENKERGGKRNRSLKSCPTNPSSRPREK